MSGNLSTSTNDTPVTDATTSAGAPTLSSSTASTEVSAASIGVSTSASSPTLIGVPTSTSASSTTSAASAGIGGVSTGSAVGIGIGCAVVGAILAGIIFMLFYRKRRQPASQKGYLPGGRAFGEQENYGMTPTRAPVGSGTRIATNVDRYLPQPVEDDAIIGELSKIRDGIKNHAQNYYHNIPVGHDAVDEARLVELANSTAIRTSDIRNLLLNPSTRVPTIRLFLAQLILSRCTGRTDGQPSFLPSEISRLAAFPTETTTSVAQAALFIKWKSISGTMLQQYGHQPNENDPRYSSITQALGVAEPVLAPLINPNADINARRRNLEGIMARAAQFGLLLFSQPGVFEFDFTSTGQPGSLVVFPALLQRVNDEAELLLPPRVMTEKEEMING